ncbi:MAG TPA: diguanylate cyclase [Rhodocyclaceae bacterium]|nr:diguanylate cyclase [Rhodocyclaceae bacterium]
MTTAHPLTLRRRLLMVALIPMVLLALGMAGMFMLWNMQSADDAMRDRALAIASFMAPAAEFGVLSGNRSTLESLMSAALEQREVVAVAIHDRDGSVIALSGRALLADTERILANRDTAILDAHSGRLSVATPVSVTRLVIDDIPANGMPANTAPVADTIGWIYLEFDTHVLAREKRLIILTALTLAAAGLALAGILAFRLARSVSEPLSRLAAAVDRMSSGELEVSVPDSASTGELRALERGFNAMARSIADAHQSLQARVDEATARLAHQALHDPLTGLPNRRTFEQALEEAVSASRRAMDHGVLCFIDLDRFKVVNDSCGHAAGDELLREIARLVRHRVRAEDLICRIGGDEFALILRACAPQEGRRIAETLREAIAGLRFTWDGRHFSIGASIGLAPIDGSMESAADVTAAADLACYTAKKKGRNRVEVHTDETSGGLRKQDLLAAPAGFSAGIQFERLSLHRQEIVNLAFPEASPPWYEILLRVVGDDGIAHPPTELLARVHGSVVALNLDLWVAEQTLLRLADIAQARDHPPPVLSFNLGLASLKDGSRYLERLERMLRYHHVAPDRIVLEFPAQLARQASAEASRLAELARALGCRIAIERLDGTTVGLLKSLHPDFAKISLKTLAESYGMEAGCNLAQALCAASAALAIPTVASEVEDVLFHAALRTYGFDHAQGHVVAPARSIDPAPGHEAPRDAAEKA